MDSSSPATTSETQGPAPGPQIYVSGTAEDAEKHARGEECPEFFHIQRVRQFITGHFFFTHKNLPEPPEDELGYSHVCPGCGETTFYYRQPHPDYKLPLCLGTKCISKQIEDVKAAVGTDYLDKDDDDDEDGEDDDEEEIEELQSIEEVD